MHTVKISGTPFKTSLAPSAVAEARKAISHAEIVTKSHLKALHHLAQNAQTDACSELISTLSCDTHFALAAAVEAARRSAFRKRPKLDDIFGVASDDPLSSRHEPVHIFMKKNTAKPRSLSSFGPRRRTAQVMAKSMLSPFYVPRTFQFTSAGVPKAIAKAVAAISDGHEYAIKLDIKQYFASFENAKLVPELPLPKEWVDNVLTGRHLVVASHSVPTPTITAARQGLLQGAISSPVVSEITISRLNWQPAEGIWLVNYADDFLILSKSEESANKHANQLQNAVAALPGGNFDLKLKATANLKEGIEFLGHLLVIEGGQPHIKVGSAAGQKFYYTLSSVGEPLNQLMPSAKCKAKAAKLIAEQWTYARSWVAAFASCEDVNEYISFAMAGIASSMHHFGLSTADIQAAIGTGHVLNVDAYDLE